MDQQKIAFLDSKFFFFFLKFWSCGELPGLTSNFDENQVLLDCGAVQADALTVDRLASLEMVVPDFIRRLVHPCKNKNKSVADDFSV